MTNQRREVIVGVDGSECSQAALRWGAHQARVLGTSLRAITTWRVPVNAGSAAAIDVPGYWNPRQEADELLRRTVGATFGDDRGPADLEMVLTVEHGSAAAVLVEASATALMLVLGSRGHGGFAGLVLGSVSTACSQHARCPVLVVHDHVDPPMLS